MVTLAASDYLNAAPVVYAFTDGSQAQGCRVTLDAAPATCARMLEHGDVDAALIPAIEYQRIPGLAVARGVCIAARRTVRSVLLICRRPLVEVRSVALDTSSRTSAALVRILLGRFSGLNPVYLDAAPNLHAMLEHSDAALLIGDPAMTADTRGHEVYDLAELWSRQTGLPFVFAFWAVRPERIPPGSLDFVAARKEGVAAAAALADRFSSKLGIAPDRLLEYLTANVHYEPDAQSEAGLDLFFRLAADEGLIQAPRPIVYWPA